MVEFLEIIYPAQKGCALQEQICGMRTVKIDSAKILDKDGFHRFFSDLFGFPDYYGSNMNAWIDCMTYLDDKESGMTTKINVNKGELIVLQLENAEALRKQAPEVYSDLIKCSAFVNYRRIEVGETPLIILAF